MSSLVLPVTMLVVFATALRAQDGPLPDAPVRRQATVAEFATETTPDEAVKANWVATEPERRSALVQKPNLEWVEGQAGEGDVADEAAGAPENLQPGLRIDLDDLMEEMDRPEAGPPWSGAERFHWKGLLWESFAFFGVENSQRLMADHYFRQLTADRPFWHDYFASLKHWNWRRWNDGDDFLVAYIAHPLQGSVTEFIELQNSPRDRDLRISDGRPYWRSRLGPALLWATAYSTDQKLGPLGEAALGSEGGYTYVIGCPYYCSAYFENPSQFKVTNNTGWVKLVTTPVVGTLWTVMEDAIDHFISDRVQGDDLSRVFPKILRGSLNPARTMANALRWRTPWYRDWQHGTEDQKMTPTVHFLPGDDDVIRVAPQYEVFPHVEWISLPVNTGSCMHCRETLTGYGIGFSKRVATYADLDSDWNFISDASPVPSDRAGGSIVMGTVGLKSGYTNQFFSLKAFLRPGFLSYDRAYQSSPSATNLTPTIGRVTHFTAAIGVEGDYPINRHLALRGVFGNQPVRYREAYVDPPGPGIYPYLNWLSRLYFLTNENWTYQTGAVVRF